MKQSGGTFLYMEIYSIKIVTGLFIDPNVCSGLSLSNTTLSLYIQILFRGKLNKKIPQEETTRSNGLKTRCHVLLMMTRNM